MKQHFKKQRRQNIYENLVNDQKDDESDEGILQKNTDQTKAKYLSSNVTKVNLAGSHSQGNNSKKTNVFNMQREIKTINFKTPPNE